MPKKKGTPGGNPSPVQTEEFKGKQFRAQGNPVQPLAKKPIACKFEEDVDAVLRQMPDAAAWLRQAVREKLIEAGLI